MPVYFFDTIDTGETLRDGEGMELPSFAAARKEALTTLGEIAKDELPDGDCREFVITIREGDGPVILTASLSLRVERSS